jgi:hypothetical protein
MPYRLHMFGSTPLPLGMAEDDLSTGAVDSGLLASVGGSFDALAGRRVLPRRRTISHSGMYRGELAFLVTHAGDNLVDGGGNTLIAGAAKTMLRQQVDALRAKIGQADSLWRLREDDGSLQWVTARLLAVGYDQRVEDVQTATLRSQFETLMAGWRSQAARTASVAYPTTGGNLLVHNGGTLPIDDAVLTITASSTITSLTITMAGGVQLLWSGSLTAGQALTIDCGRRTVIKAGTTAYAGWSLGASHTMAGWLQLAVGNNWLSVTGAGAGTVAASWYDQFA